MASRRRPQLLPFWSDKNKRPFIIIIIFLLLLLSPLFCDAYGTARHGRVKNKRATISSQTRWNWAYHSSLLFCCLGWNDTCGGCGGTEVGTKVRNIKIPITSSQTTIQVHRGRYDAMPLGQRVFPIYCCETIPMYYIASQTDTVWQAGRQGDDDDDELNRRSLLHYISSSSFQLPGPSSSFHLGAAAAVEYVETIQRRG